MFTLIHVENVINIVLIEMKLRPNLSEMVQKDMGVKHCAFFCSHLMLEGTLGWLHA